MISETLVDFVKGHEGIRLEAYKDSGGIWTIGYGSTGPDIIKGATWTQPQAEFRLQTDLQGAQNRALGLIKRNLPQGCCDALTDFVYNLGQQALSSSHLLQCVNSGDDIGAAKAFLVWDHVGAQEVKGLLIRRMEEAVMYLRGIE